jgi:hypothetical protein
VIPRRIFHVLVGAAAVLVVAFTMLMAFFLLVRSLGDETAARALLWTAVACLILTVTDLFLLVLALGLKAIQDDDSPSGE